MSDSEGKVMTSSSVFNLKRSRENNVSPTHDFVDNFLEGFSCNDLNTNLLSNFRIRILRHGNLNEGTGRRLSCFNRLQVVILSHVLCSHSQDHDIFVGRQEIEG